MNITKWLCLSIAVFFLASCAAPQSSIRTRDRFAYDMQSELRETARKTQEFNEFLIHQIETYELKRLQQNLAVQNTLAKGDARRLVQNQQDYFIGKNRLDNWVDSLRKSSSIQRQKLEAFAEAYMQLSEMADAEASIMTESQRSILNQAIPALITISQSRGGDAEEDIPPSQEELEEKFETVTVERNVY